MNTDFIHWYGQSAFRFEDGSMQIYIDPFKLPSKGLPKADVILITHSHFDHFSPDDIEKIKKNQTTFFIPSDLSGKINGDYKIVKPDQEYQIGKIKIKTIPAYNLEKKFHPKSNNWVGYIVTLSNGLTIYHAGDTDTIPEMKELHVDIALMPVGGTYTMNAEEAAGIVNIFQPRIAIPMHYGSAVGTDKDAELFKKIVKSITVIKMREK
jgi:L-ascorbate metabolism protein UlaG (beta-lactamase superfamily)